MRAVVVLAVVLALSFFFLHAIPGDPAAIRIGEHATPAEVARVRLRLGLDRPLAEQFARYAAAVLRGDLGRSLADDEPVIGKLAVAVPSTLELGCAALLVAVLAGVPLGTFAAVRRGTPLAALASAVGTAGISIPAFWLGWLLIYVFAAVPAQAGRPHFPITGESSLAFALPARTHVVVLDALLAGNGAAVADGLARLVLPAIALGTIPLAVLAKITRTAMIEALSADFVRTARAKGLGPFRVVVRHALRSAAVPILAVSGVQSGLLLGGAVLVEQVFGRPGIGRLVFDAVEARDFPLVDGCALVFALLVVFLNAGADLAASLLDPRLRSSARDATG